MPAMLRLIARICEEQSSRWFHRTRMNSKFRDRFPLGRVVEDGRGAVCINVTDLVWLELGLCQCLFHGAARTTAVGIWLRQMMIVGGNSVAGYLSKNLRAMAARGLQFFQRE